MSQSIQARIPSRIGAPEPAVCHPSPRNLSSPFEAKRRHTSSWASASTLTQKWPLASIFGHDDDPVAGKHATIGGSRETDANDPTASPTGPSDADAVTTVTPAVKCPSTWRKRPSSKGELSVMEGEPNPSPEADDQPLVSGHDLVDAGADRELSRVGEHLVDGLVVVGGVVVEHRQAAGPRLSGHVHGVVDR